MISLSDDELQIVMDCARPLAPRDRAEFLRDVAAELARYELLGPGIVGQVVAKDPAQISRPARLSQRRQQVSLTSARRSCQGFSEVGRHVIRFVVPLKSNFPNYPLNADDSAKRADQIKRDV